MILVRHAMSSDLKTAMVDMAADAAGLMRSYDIGVVPVLDGEGGLAGLVTDRDIVVRVIADRQDADGVRLGDILTRTVVTVTPDTSLSEARDLMAERRIRRLPVMKEKAVVGILSLGDVALADQSKRAVGHALENVSESASTAGIDEDGPERGTPARVHGRRRAS
jgi:CBS-domain-containing membrane protein